MFKTKTFIICIILLVTISCGRQQNNNQKITADITSTIKSQNQVDTISKQNNDIKTIDNISRPKTSKIISSKFPVDKLFGIWTYDPTGPHADFELTKISFYVVDYDGDGDMPYILNKDTLTVFYKDFVTKGLIKKVNKDSLTIAWDDNEDTYYSKWTQ